MFVNILFLGTNPFFEAYFQSDFLGKMIMVGLLCLSVCTWIVLGYKGWITYKARINSGKFNIAFQGQKMEPLNVKFPPDHQSCPNPFYSLYGVLKKQTLEILSKNRVFGKSQETFLSAADVEFIDAQLISMIALQVKHLEKNLFILSTIVSLAPFLGLLGTVWGILTTFSGLQTTIGGLTSQVVIGGLSLALATTVLGLINAIPALIGYNYLKNAIQEFETDMEGFSIEILSAVELHYRKVEIDR